MTKQVNSVVKFISTCLALFLINACTALGNSSDNKNNGISPPIGIVTASKGYPSVVRRQQTYLLSSQARIYQGDVIETDYESKLHIRMNDDTTIELGANSHFVLHEFNQALGIAAPVARFSLTSGSLRSKTGNIMASSRARFEINTPQALIGIRGTDFWTGFIFGEDTVDVAMIEGKGVYVKNQHGQVELVSASQGTTVIGHSAPQSAKTWPQRKIDRALSETGI